MQTAHYPPAKEDHSPNPTVEQQRITDLLKRTADDLFQRGARPQTRFLVHLTPRQKLHVEQTSTSEAA